MEFKPLRETPEASEPSGNNHVKALRRLIRELNSWGDDREVSSADKPEIPQRIEKGHPVHDAVVALQFYYPTEERPDGILPIAGGAWQAWQNLLLYSRAQGGESPTEQARKAYQACDAICEWAANEQSRISKPDLPRGFFGGEELANALGVHATRQEAFLRQLDRQRTKLGDDCWREVSDPQPNKPKYLYRADSPKLQELAEEYRKPKTG